MDAANLNVRISGELRHHLLQQVGAEGLYENASEYIRDLIRRDLKSKREAWEWLAKELEAGLRADESEFLAITSRDVIARNKKRRKK